MRDDPNKFESITNTHSAKLPLITLSRMVLILVWSWADSKLILAEHVSRLGADVKRPFSLPTDTERSAQLPLHCTIAVAVLAPSPRGIFEQSKLRVRRPQRKVACG